MSIAFKIIRWALSLCLTAQLSIICSVAQSAHIDIQTESYGKSHIIYVPLPSNFSKKDLTVVDANVKAQLHDVAKAHFKAKIQENASDILVIFTDMNGEAILPDMEASLAKSNLGSSNIYASESDEQLGNEITFTFNSPNYPWTTDELTQLHTMIDDFYPVIKQVYGDPAFNITVNIIKDPTISDAGLYYVSANEIVMQSLKADVLCHETIHAFRDDSLIYLQSYEEGMTRAAEIEVFDRTGYAGGFEHHSYYYDVEYEKLNSPVIGSRDGNFHQDLPTFFLLRYQLAGYAWGKAILENEYFLANFNREFYSRLLTDPTVKWTEEKLINILLAVQPSIEGKPTLTWYAQQGVLNTNPPNGYFLHPRPYFTEDYFYRNSAGSETMQSNASVSWAVYSHDFNLLDSGTGVTTSYGWMDFIPQLPPGYQGRITVQASANSAEGMVTDSYYSFASGSRLKAEGIYGIFPNSDTGMIKVTLLNNPAVSYSTSPKTSVINYEEL